MKITEVAAFRCPVETVFALIADGTQAVRWVQGVVRSERVGEAPGAPIGVGSRFRWIVQLGPLMREENAQQITIFRPNEEIGFRATAGMPLEGRWLFQVKDGVTEVTYEAVMATEGRLLGRLMGSKMGQELWAATLRASLGRLRGLVEGRP